MSCFYKMKTRTVLVVDYDPAWPGQFRAIAAEVAAALGELALSIEHVGSTAVPGLAAKPIIDLDVVIPGEADLAQAIRRLEAIGYLFEGDLGIPDRYAFRYEHKPHLQKHHLYVCPRHSRELHRHRTFRDYLRTHPQAVAAYSQAKKDAAGRFPDDIDAYIAHKSPCIAQLYRECGLE